MEAGSLRNEPNVAIDPQVQYQIEKTLASMGGDLMATYGPMVEAIPDELPEDGSVYEEQLKWMFFASLGGYLTERFGQK